MIFLILQCTHECGIFCTKHLQNGWTALHYACFGGNIKIVALLLETQQLTTCGLVNIQDKNGDTALHLASRSGYREIVKKLLNANTDKDLRNKVSFLVVLILFEYNFFVDLLVNIFFICYVN